MSRPRKEVTAKAGKNLCQLRVPVNWYVQFAKHATKTGRFMQDIYIEALEKIVANAESSATFYPFRAAFAGEEAKTYNLWIPQALYERIRAISEDQSITQTAIIWTALCEVVNYEQKRRVATIQTKPEKGKEG